MKSLVVGIEDTAEGRDALAFAKKLVEASRARIHVVSVEPTTIYYLGEGDMAEARKAHFEDARSVAEKILGEDFEFHEVVESSPATGLAAIADEVDADAIVAGSCHRGPIGRVLIGDTVSLLVAGAPRPVIIVPRGVANGVRPDGFGRIGVGFDGSNESELALQTARRLALDTGAELRLIGVVRRMVHPGPYATVYVGAQRSLETAMDELLAKRAAEITDLEVGTERFDGVPSDQLVKATGQLDLLVLGSRGYGPVRRAFLGSTSLPVVRGAACPIVVVPRGD